MKELKEKLDIKNLIYEIDGKQVMLDCDLAKLYECKNGTKEINQAVKNNLDKFPQRFSYFINEYDLKNLRSKFLTSSLINNYGGRRYNIRVFTEQGIYMLATILKTKVASQVTVNIMDAFVEMRKLLNSNLIEQKYINNLVLKDNKRIDVLEELMSNFKEKNHHIFFEGQIYDAYSLMIDIFNKSKNEIIIIDNYIDKNLLDILSKTNKKVILITNRYNNQDYNKYILQYKNIELKINNRIHDRFIIIDKEIIYHCGASFKDLGNKCFAISKIEDKDYLKTILLNIN